MIFVMFFMMFFVMIFVSLLNHHPAPLGRDVRVVVRPVALRHRHEAAVPHERPVLRARADVDPAAQDKAVGDAIARWYWRVVTVTEWGPVKGKCPRLQ